MKKFFTYFIFTLLLSAFGFSSFAQTGGAFQYFPKDIQNAEIKRINKLNGIKLKSGVNNIIKCLVPSVCESSAQLELTPNSGWVFDDPDNPVISWNARKVTGISGTTILVVDFPVGTLIVSYDGFAKKWFFNPDQIPVLEDGQFIQIVATYKAPLSDIVVEDYVYYRKLPSDIAFVSSTSSMCAGEPTLVSLVNSAAPAGPNTVNPTIVTTTKYALLKDGIATGDTILGTGNQIDFNVTDPGVYTINAIVVPDKKYGPTDVCETTMGGSTTVTVNPLPIITASSNSEICTNETLNLLGGIPNPALLYSWTGPNGFTSPSQTTFITNATTAASGEYKLVGTIVATGCVDSAKTVVVVNPLPIIQLNSLTSTPCVNNALGEEYTTDLGMDNYVWTFPGSTEGAGNDYLIVSGSGTNKIYVNWLTPGLKTIAVNYDTPAPAGCTLPSPKTITVTVNPLPTITKTNTDKESCKNFGDTYSTEPLMSGYNWVITSGTGTIQAGTENTANAVITWTSGSTGSVTVSYVNNGCLSTSAPYTVTINDLPNATATNSGAACEGSNITLTGGANGLTSYAWSGPNSYSSATQSPVLNDVTVANAGSYTITVTDNNGCVNTASTNVVVNAQPDATFTPNIPGAVCQGTTVQYTTQGAPNNSWDWTVVGGNIAAGGDGFNTVDVTWNNAAAPTKSVTVNYKNSPAGCMDLTPQVTNVVVNPLPTPTVATGPTTPCINSTGNLYTTQVGFSGYLWTIPVGSGIITGQGTSSITVEWLTQGTHNVTVQYQSATVPACTATSPNYVVDVKPLPAVPTLTATPNPVCSGKPVVLSCVPATYTGYSWTGPDVMTSANTANATITSATTAGTYTLVVTGNFGCTNSNTVNVAINPLPTPTIITPVTLSPVCQDDVVTYTTQGAPNKLWDWTIVGGTVQGVEDGASSVTVKWDTSAGVHSIAVSYENSTNCRASTPVYPITVNPSPVPTLITPATVCVNSPGTYTTDAGMQPGSYVWSVVGGTPDVPSNSNTITVNWGAVNPSASISVYYVNPLGCKSTTKINTLAVTGLPVPTIIAPVPNNACEGDTITYTTQSGMVSGSYDWNIVSPGGTPISTTPYDHNFSVVWSGTGNKTVTVNYSNGCTGASAASRTLNIQAIPTPSIFSAGGTLCEGVTKVQYSTETGKIGYIWKITGGTITTPTNNDNIEVTWNAGAANTLSVTYTEPLTGCDGTKVNTYVVNAAPVPTLTDWDNIECVRLGVEPLRNYTTQPGNSAYSWGITGVNSGGITAGGSTNQISVNWSTATPVGVPDTVLVNYTNAAGCSAVNPAKYPVTVEARPVPAFSPLPNPKACLGESVTYTAQAGMSSYDWNVSAGGNIISGENTASCVIKWNVLGAQTVSVTYSSVAGGCPATAYTDFGVTVNALPITPPSGPTDVCTGSTTMYSAPAGTNNWTWVISGGNVVSFNTTSNTVDVKWPAVVGGGNVQLTYDDIITGCRVTLNKPITVGLQLSPSISGDNAICVGDTITYRTEAGMDSYVWTVNGGSVFAPSPATADTIVVVWNTAGGAGSNNVSVTYTPVPAGCPIVNPVPVYGVSVSALPITETISASKASVCQGDTITYSIPTGYSNILWSSTNGTPLGATNGDTYKVIWPVTGASSVTVSYENGGGCSPTVNPILNFTVNGLPNPSLNSPDTDVCFGSTGVYTTDLAPSGGYIWKVNNGNIVSGANSDKLTVTWDVVALTHSVEVNYPNINGCYALNNTVLDVTVKDLPKPSIVGSATACITKPNQVYSTSSAVGVSGWVWTISGGNIDSGQGTNSVSVTWTSTTNTWISVAYDENGCTGNSGHFDVTVNTLPVVQTAVTNPASGVYCAGGTGVSVILTASEPTVKYELRDASDVLIGTVPAGTTPVVWNNVLAGVYSVVGITPSSCTSVVASNITVTTTPLPTLHAMALTGTVVGCNGGLGYEITLGSSTVGINYQLLLNSAATGVSVPGTGAAITFGNQFSFGTYTVQATNSVTTCTQIMTGTFVMNPDAATTIYNVTSDPATGDFCNLPLNGVEVKLSGSDNGVSYILRSGSTDIETVVGTGLPINFTRIPTAGSYFVEVLSASGCRTPMNGSVTITPITPPTPFTLLSDDNGFYCSGDAGVGIRIAGQELGVVYELYEGVNPIPLDTKVGVVNNPTLPLDFTGLYGAGTYFVQASNSLVSGCMVAMINNVTVTPNALPIQYTVTSDGNICSGGTTNLNLSSSEIAAQYYWINLVDNSVSAPINGTGSAISFPITLAGDYSIVSSITSNGITCSSSMVDTISIAVQSLPSDVSLALSGGTGCNDGVVITIKNSESGVTYSALDQATLLSPIPSIVGNGLDISFAPIVDNGKIYIVEATLGGCPRIVGVPVNVNVSGVVVKQTVTGGGAICSGASATIGLADTEVGVQYDLYLADSPGGTSSSPAIGSLIGDGSAKDFGATITINGEYYVVGTAIGCSNEMSNRVNVSINAPVVGSISVAPSANVCVNTPVVFTGRGGDQYTFYLNNASLGIAADSTLTLPSVNNGDQVKVLVVNSISGCNNLTLPITLSVVDELTPFTLLSVSNGSICPATTDSLYLSGSEWGVDYVLFDGTDTPIDTISGNNGIIYYPNIAPGSYYVVAETVGGSPCGNKAMNDTVTVAVSPLPAVYNQTPTGVETGCIGGTIDLNGSDLGVTYHLLRNGTTVIATQVGTGAAISFAKPLVAGIYTIRAIYGNGCNLSMNGSLNISNPVTENIYVLNAIPVDGKYCNNGSNLGVSLTLSNSDAGKTYTLFNGVTFVDDSVSVGGPILFGTFPTAGFYSVQVASTNGCFDIMDSVVHIQPILPPSVYSLIADDNGFYCSNGGTGVGIQLVGQQLNVNYGLYMGGTLVGSAVGIDDNPITPLPFLNISNSSYRFTAQGSYSVTASYTSPVGCDVNMANSITVTPSSDPASFLVTSTGDFCEGGSTTINLNGSDPLVDYRWVNITTTDAGAWTSGTGGLVQFSGINISGDYVVEAISNNGPSCSTVLSDTITIKEVKLPLNRNFTVKDGADCSSSSLVIVENAEVGVTYTIVDAATDTPTSIFFVGTTNLLDTMQIIDSNGLYYLSAQRGSCPTRIAPNFIINNPGGAVKKQIVTPIDASICNGDLGVKFGLQTTASDVKYILYWSADNIRDIATDQKVDSITSLSNGINIQFKKLGKKPGKYYVYGINLLDPTCTNFMSNEPDLVVNPLPTAFMITGSGLYCDPDPDPKIGGAVIGLEKQEDRVLYTLQQYNESDVYQDDVLEFRGSLSGLPFQFGSFKEDGANNVYRVVAIDTLTGCTSNMNGRVLVQQTPFSPVVPVVDLGATNGKYCSGTNGVEVKVTAPEVGITYQVVKIQLPTDTVLFERVAVSTADLTLGYFDLGSYYVKASWGGDACIQQSDSFDIVPRVPIAFNVDYDCHASSTDLNILSGGYVSLDSSEIGITYLLYNQADTSLVGFETGTDNMLEFKGIYGVGSYFVQATCSPSAPAVDMANSITIEMPVNTYDVGITNRSALLGIRGDTILQYGSQLDHNYYLRINNWVDTFAVGTGNPLPELEFPTDSAGNYHILAISDKNCAAIIDKDFTIMETLLIAYNDTVYFPDQALTYGVNVSLNDIIDRANVDKNVVFKIVTSGAFNDIQLDSITGDFIYNKPPSFYGRDSIRYEVRNTDLSSRADTALIWVYIGNKPINGKSFLIPNAFSPNNDKVNDKYVIQTLYSGTSTTESVLEVYNRWGSIVYRSKEKTYNNDWDGTTNTGMLSIGSELPNGTYFYVFKVTFNLDGLLQKEEYNGYIELRR